MILLAVTIASRPDGLLHVTALDIGQGDAILVEAPSGATMLVDGGPDPELTLRRLGAKLPFFARGIDLLVLSHPHQDHVAGLVDVLARFRVGALLHAGIGFENAAYDHLMADADLEPAARVAGGAGGPTVPRSIRQPRSRSSTPREADAAAPLPEGDINNGSVVMVVRHGGFAALLTGDAEAPVEAMLVERELLPAVDLLKVGHHGSTSSTTPGLLDGDPAERRRHLVRRGQRIRSSGAGDACHPCVAARRRGVPHRPGRRRRGRHRRALLPRPDRCRLERAARGARHRERG